MKNHLTENQLIEYQFKLGSQEQQNASSRHLAGCEECRLRLEKLNKKFASLDLLCEDAHASEELISQVMAQAKQPARQKLVPLYKSPWFGAVAAALVVGFVLLMSNLKKDEPARQQFAKEPESMDKYISKESETKGQAKTVQPTRRFGQDADVKIEMPTVAAQPAPEEAATRMVAKGTSDLPAPVKGPARDITPLGDAMAPTSESISELPPFAPASAIELVTLPRRDNVQLTIYNSADLTLVREKRNLTLKKGWNWLQFMWANTLIDPTSLSLEPLEQREKIDIQQLVFPARLRELGRWLIHSEISGQVPFEITYFTSGLSWRAFYMGTLSQDEKTMKMQGYVRIGNNSGEDYDNARTRLIVGQVHMLDEIAQLAKRQYPYDRPGLEFEHELRLGRQAAQTANEPVILNYSANWRELDKLDRKEIRKEGLSEYFLYTIEGAETIPNEWGKRLLSFEAEDIAVESLYKYDEERWGNYAIRFVTFANDKKHNLGQTPIPNGNVKIYSHADEQSYLSYVGGTNIKYIPVDEEIELNLGPARLVKIEPKLMDFKTENYIFDNRGNVSGWDEIRKWKIEITNTRTLPIQIEITRCFDTPYWILQSETPYEKYDALHARFMLELESYSKQTMEYTVRTYYGTREESLKQ